MITMRDISRFCAETLNDSIEFKALSTSLISANFTYYVNIDHRQTDAIIPYFSIATYNDEDDKETRKAFKTIFLIGIDRIEPVTANGITEEPSLDKLEELARKAIDIISKDLRMYGINGEMNIKVGYINMYVPNPEGEKDLQMQVDIEFEQEKYLNGC